MKRYAAPHVHLKALESRLVRLQMLERECVFLKGQPGRSAMRAKRTDLIVRTHAYLNWLFASQLLEPVDYGRITKVFEKATKQTWWTSNATLWADDHPLIKDLRLAWRWAQFKRTCRVSVKALVLAGGAYG